jgi:hypothetical protein
MCLRVKREFSQDRMFVLKSMVIHEDEDECVHVVTPNFRTITWVDGMLHPTCPLSDMALQRVLDGGPHKIFDGGVIHSLIPAGVARYQCMLYWETRADLSLHRGIPRYGTSVVLPAVARDVIAVGHDGDVVSKSLWIPCLDERSREKWDKDDYSVFKKGREQLANHLREQTAVEWAEWMRDNFKGDEG